MMNTSQLTFERALQIGHHRFADRPTGQNHLQTRVQRFTISRFAHTTDYQDLAITDGANISAWEWAREWECSWLSS